MSLTPAVLDALLAAGATAEMLVAAYKADLAEQEERAARQIPWPKLRQMAIDRDGDVCGWCETTDGPFEVDHIVPRAAGGENVLENVVVSCRPCNRAKKDRQGDDWTELRERRAKDRDRKRAERAASRRVRGQSKDKLGQTPTPSPNDIYSNPQPDLPTKPNGLEPKPKKHRMPVDWEPKPFTPATLAAQVVARWEPGRMERELSKFRDHYTASGTKWENWQAVWSKWVNNSDDFQRGPQNGQSQSSGVGVTGRAVAKALAGFDHGPPRTSYAR